MRNDDLKRFYPQGGDKEDANNFVRYDEDGKIPGELSECPYEQGLGRDSAVKKTVNIPTDVDDEGHQIDRTNTCEGAFSAVLAGSRNLISELASESGVTGGLNEDYAQDNFMFGYRCISNANQNLTGGYRVHNDGSESVGIGSNVEIQGNITYDAKGNPVSDTKSVTALGTGVYVGAGSKNSLVVGDNIEKRTTDGVHYGPGSLMYSIAVGQTLKLYDSIKWSIIIGARHSIGKHSECVNVFDFHNIVGDYVTDSTLFGYDNTILGGTSSDKIYDVYEFGHENTNEDFNGVAQKNVYEIGRGLKPSKEQQVVLGSYNDEDETAELVVGCGYEETVDEQTVITRENCFSTGKASSVPYIKIGGTTLTETQLTGLLALLTAVPSEDGTYSFKATVSDGSVTYSWVQDQ